MFHGAGASGDAEEALMQLTATSDAAPRGRWRIVSAYG